MTRTIKFTVITVVYNGLPHIVQAVESVINQDYPALEYIVIDGGSTDGTLAALAPYLDRFAYFVSEPDKGIYDAMNKGLSKATGDYVIFKNADDWFCEGALDQAALFLAARPVDLLSGNTLKVWSENPLTVSEIKPTLSGLRVRTTLDHRCTFIKRTLHQQVPYDLRFRLVADYVAIVTMLNRGVTWAHLDQPISYMRTGGASDRFKVINENYRAQKQLFGAWHASRVWLQNTWRFYRWTTMNRMLKLFFGEKRYQAWKGRKAKQA